MNFLGTRMFFGGHSQQYPKSVTVMHFLFNCEFFITLIGGKNCQLLRMQNFNLSPVTKMSW